MEVTGDDVHFVGFQHGTDIFEIFHSAGGPVLHLHPVGGDAGGGQVVEHALGLGKIVFVALAAGDDAPGVGVSVQVLQGGVEPLPEHGGRLGAVDGGSQDDEDFAGGFSPAVHAASDQAGRDQNGQEKDCRQDGGDTENGFLHKIHPFVFLSV